MMPDKTGLWGALGTQKAVRIVTLMMIIYAIIIGGLVVGYANVSNCLAAYSDEAAGSTAARAKSAAEDRVLNAAEARLDNSERTRLRTDQAALLKLIRTLGSPDATEADRASAFTTLEKVNTESSRILAANDEDRGRITQERVRIEEDRQANPPPRPPSETC